MQGWLKVYYRDSNKVMRSIKGIKILPNNMVTLDKSVYTLNDLAGKYWMEVK